MNTMSKEELRIKAAKLVGWNFSSVDGVVFNAWKEKDGFRYYPPEGIPDYPNDIAAAYELEGMIPDFMHGRYLRTLRSVINKERDFEYENQVWEVAHATAEQRTRAFVMTMEVENES